MLVRHTLLYLPAQGIGPAIQFATIVLWAHVLSPADMGVLTIVIALQEIISALSFSWWSQFALRFIARFSSREDRNTFIGTEGMALILSTLLQSILILPALAVFGPGLGDAPLVIVTLLFVTTRSLVAYVSDRARAEALILLYSLLQTACPLAGLLLGVAMFRLTGASVFTVFCGFVIAQALALIVSCAMCDLVRRPPALDWKVLRQAAAFGIPVMLAGMLAVIAVSAPRFIVERFVGLSAVGLFSVGYGLGLRASSFASMLVTAGAYPIVVQKMETEGLSSAYAQLAKNITLLAFVVAPVASGLLAVNHPVVDLIIPAQYRDLTYFILPFATLGGLFRYLRAHTVDQVFLLRSKPGYITIIAIIDLLLAVVSSAVGLIEFGVIGAALGPMISSIITFLASWVTAIVLLRVRPPYAPLVGIIVSSSMMALFVYFLPVSDDILGLLLRIGTGILVYGVAALGLVSSVRDAFVNAARTIFARATMRMRRADLNAAVAAESRSSALEIKDVC